jgi:hypothetical protein
MDGKLKEASITLDRPLKKQKVSGEPMGVLFDRLLD